ncbi:hypothetical protein NO995_00900 [Aestuariibaculum sp. M13]|uniref:hypothetical protein n=1 Tax=Aestuariibaculum sp. M13 TaxID=2967132 RepID=UPI002159F7F6|nr:hypothetical protein [Aestuariibaculum sp. M13]MCR8666229.1 hypothetical protein [Aestuariibaculum sp. M13]
MLVAPNTTEEKIVSSEDLIDKISKQVYQSRELIEGNGGFHIRRGMAHKISGYCEDLFALYIAQHINRHDYQYYVDKVISTKFEGDKKSTSFKPDLAIINEQNVLTHYFDLKTNLGWNRHLKDYLTKKNEFITNLKAKGEAWITSKKEWLALEDKEGKEIEFNRRFPLPDYQKITISDSLKYHMVVIFGGNINEKDMVKNMDIANGFDKNIALDVLYQNNTINNTAFSNIHKALKNNYKE